MGREQKVYGLSKNSDDLGVRVVGMNSTRGFLGIQIASTGLTPYDFFRRAIEKAMVLLQRLLREGPDVCIVTKVGGEKVRLFQT
jgi:hypothetical protein